MCNLFKIDTDEAICDCLSNFPSQLRQGIQLQANMAAKRPRTPSSSSSLLPTLDAASPDPPPKASRIHPSETDGSSTQSEVVGHPILCNLPPTCHHKPTPIPNTNELERHYALYHAHVCGVEDCGSVFPEARLLELVSFPDLCIGFHKLKRFIKHQTECHDPIAALKKERNEKIVRPFSFSAL